MVQTDLKNLVEMVHYGFSKQFPKAKDCIQMMLVLRTGREDKDRDRNWAWIPDWSIWSRTISHLDHQIPERDLFRFLPWLFLGSFVEDEVLKMALFRDVEGVTSKAIPAYLRLVGTIMTHWSRCQILQGSGGCHSWVSSSEQGIHYLREDYLGNKSANPTLSFQGCWALRLRACASDPFFPSTVATSLSLFSTGCWYFAANPG